MSSRSPTGAPSVQAASADVGEVQHLPLPGFPTDREGYIAALNAHIAAGNNVENSRAALEFILSQPPEPSLPEELAALPKAVANRILVLQRMQASPEGQQPENTVNIRGIMEDYLTRRLSVDDNCGKVCYYFNGKKKSEWVDMYDKEFDLDAKWEQWREEENGEGQLWMETSFAFPQMAARISSLP